MQKFKNKYRVPSARLEGWDYSAAGAYFITICTLDKQHHFGNIREGAMHLSAAGQQVHNYWHQIPFKFPHVHLNAFVVMPNHLHGVLLLESKEPAVLEKRLVEWLPGPLEAVIQPAGGCTGLHNPMFAEGLGRILRWYKGRCTYEIHKDNPYFCWQERFWDTIIWNQPMLERVQHYIETNIERWAKDPYRT